MLHAQMNPPILSREGHVSGATWCDCQQMQGAKVFRFNYRLVNVSSEGQGWSQYFDYLSTLRF